MDDRIYNEYMSLDERLMTAESLSEDYDVDRYMLMIEMVDRHLDINLRKAELKVLVEGGTYEDLEYLYEEAEQEATAQKKGIVQSIVSAITGAFQAIINGIRKFFKLEKNPEEMVEVDEQAWQASHKLGMEWDKVSGQLDGDPSDENHWKDAVPKILAGALAAVGIVAGGKYVGKKIKVRAADQEKQGTKISQICQKIVDISNKFTDSKVFSFVKTPFEKLKNGIKSILSKIGINFGKDKSEMSEKDKQEFRQWKKDDNEKKIHDRQEAAKLNGVVFDQGKAAANVRSIITKNKKILPFIKNGAVNETGIIDAIKRGELDKKDIKDLFSEPMVRDDPSKNRSDGRSFRINRRYLTRQNLDKMVDSGRNDNFNYNYLCYLVNKYKKVNNQGGNNNE